MRDTGGRRFAGGAARARSSRRGEEHRRDARASARRRVRGARRDVQAAGGSERSALRRVAVEPVRADGHVHGNAPRRQRLEVRRCDRAAPTCRRHGTSRRADPAASSWRSSTPASSTIPTSTASPRPRRMCRPDASSAATTSSPSDVGSPTLPLNFVANDGDGRDPDPTDPGRLADGGRRLRGRLRRAGGQQLARDAHGRRRRGDAPTTERASPASAGTSACSRSARSAGAAGR